MKAERGHCLRLTLVALVQGMNKFLKFHLLFIFITLPLSLTAQISFHWKEILDSTQTGFAINPLNPNTIIAERWQIRGQTACNNLWISYNAGDDWQKHCEIDSGNYAISYPNILYCPTDSNVLLAQGKSIYKSWDGGKHWLSVLDSPSGFGGFEQHVDFNRLNPSIAYSFYPRSGIVYASLDTGTTWLLRSQISAIIDYRGSIVVNSIDPNLILVFGEKSGVFRSADGGHTWSVSKHTDCNSVRAVVWDKDNKNIAYVSFEVDGEGGIYKTTDAGLNWVLCRSQTSYNLAVDSGQVYTGNYGVFTSYDNGNSWQKLGLEGPGPWVIKSGSDHAVYSNGQSKLTVLRRIGTGKISGTVRNSLTGQPIDYAEIKIIETGDDVTMSNKDGRYAAVIPPGTYTVEVSFGTMQKTYSNISVVLNTTNNYDFELPIDEKFESYTGRIHNAFGAGIQSRIYLGGVTAHQSYFNFTSSTDEDGNFTIPGLSNLSYYYPPYVEPKVKPYVETLVGSPDFTDFNHIQSLSDILIEPADLIVVNQFTNYNPYEYRFIPYNRTSAWNTLTDGETVPLYLIGLTKKKTVLWVMKPDSLSKDALESLTNICQKGYNLILFGRNPAVSTYSTTFFNQVLGISKETKSPSVDYLPNGGSGSYVKGAEDSPISDGLRFILYKSSFEALKPIKSGVVPIFNYVNNRDSSFVAGVLVNNTGNGGRAVFFNFDPSSYYVPGDTILFRSLKFFEAQNLMRTFAQTPSLLSISQNFPNPFNPTTKVRFILSQPSKVTCKIYDVLGQEIRTILRGELLTGAENEFTWDGRDNAGKIVSSGIYFYRLTAGNTVKAKKMLLIK